MSGLWARPELATCGFFGLGGVLLGLASLVRGGVAVRSPWTLAGPALLTLLAAIGAGRESPPSLWCSPLGLAAVWALCHLACSPVLERIGGTLTFLRHPRGQGVVLLATSAALTLAWLCLGQ